MAYVTIFLCWKKTQYKSTFRNFIPNLPVSAILVLPVFSRIFQYLQYWYYQYFPESSSICNRKIRYEVAECTFILGFFSTQKNRDIRHYSTWFVQLLLTLLQFSTQIFQALQNVCAYNEGVHITEWHSTLFSIVSTVWVSSGPLQIWFFLQTCLKVPMVHQTVTTKVCI
jgi:hypothetical protein